MRLDSGSTVYTGFESVEKLVDIASYLCYFINVFFNALKRNGLKHNVEKRNKDTETVENIA